MKKKKRIFEGKKRIFEGKNKEVRKKNFLKQNGKTQVISKNKCRLMILKFFKKKHE